MIGKMRRIHCIHFVGIGGSGMSGIIDCEERIDFNLAVSTGQELSVSMDQYMDYALEQPSTRVIGLFMETARNPQGLIAAFNGYWRTRVRCQPHRRCWNST